MTNAPRPRPTARPGARPMEGVGVVELGALVSGPFATMFLAEQGADVIKVETVGGGDTLRALPIRRGGVSSIFLNMSRGKRSIAVDISTPAGRDVVLDLYAGADVVVENFRPGVADRLGVGYGAACDRRADIVYASISGYGPTGPLAGQPVVDPVIQAHVGMVARQMPPDLPLPDLVRTMVVDKTTALIVAQAVSAALFRRERTGEGDHLEIPMLDAALHWYWPDSMADHTFLGDGVQPGGRIVDVYGLTECADGNIVLFAATEVQRRGIYAAIGRADLGDDPRWLSPDPAERAALRADAGVATAAGFRALTTAEAIARLREHDVPCSPLNEPDAVVADEQIAHNEALVEWEHPTAGRVRQPRHPVRFASSATPVPESAPLLGEHTDEILRAIGRSDDEIAALRDAGTVA